MSLAEGPVDNGRDNGTLENKMEEQLELGTQQDVPPQYDASAPVVVVTNPNVQQTQQVTNYASSNNKLTASVGVSGSVLVPVNNGGNNNYFQPRQDTGEYDENMKPWETDGQNYSFACCTEYSIQAGKKKGNINKQSQNVEIKWVHTVYHKTGSNRLIVKKKEAESSLEKAKNNPMTKWTILVAILGVLLAVIGAFRSVEIGAAGVVMIIISGFMCCCFQRKKSLVRDTEMITQSIPIKSIFYVERTVSQLEEADQCCCGPQEEAGIQYSDISIGYNRSNLSSKLQASASKQDFCTFSLIANQSYNLHQYINSIIDGTHPQTRNVNDNALPGIDNRE